mgnify:CR=1 FL=1
MREWSERHPELDKNWYKDSNYLVCLSAPLAKIDDLIKKCEEREIPYATFVEPDFDNRITGVALAPCDESRRITSSLPLALRI